MDEFGQIPYDADAGSENYTGPDAPNVLGIVGFVLSFTCVLSPVGLLMSLFALTKPRKGFAIAGTVGGSVLTIVVGFLTYSGIMLVANPHMRAQAETGIDFAMVQASIDQAGTVPVSLDAPGVEVPSMARTDYWNTPYVYAEDGAGNWSLTTLGPDKAEGGGDDVTLTSSMNQSEIAQAIDEVLPTWKAAMRKSPEQVQGGAADEAPVDAPADPPDDDADTPS